MAYATRSQAQQYFDGRLNTQSWDSASPTDQQKALVQATTLIEQLNFAGERTVTTQALQFPRSGDTTVPQAILNACAEVALALLDGIDPNREARNAGASLQAFAGVRTQRATDYIQEWILAGIPSPVAWNFLRPFLNDPQAIILSRVD